MKKKSNIVMCMILSFLMVGMVAKAASTYETVTINKRQDSVESDAVGTSKEAIYVAVNDINSTASLAMKAYARYTILPYSLEYTTTVSPGGGFGHREMQEHSSYFYIELVGKKKCNGEGSVEIVK